MRHSAHQLALVAMATLTLLLSRSPICLALTEAERTEVLDFHNYLRRNVVPRAANMNKLSYSVELEKLAQRAADTCKFQHNYGGDYDGLGENLYKGGRSNISEALMMMYLEREQYNLTANVCKINNDSKYTMFSSCGHYFQLVTSSLYYVGCGIKECDGNYLIACEYNRGWATPPYIAGEPGSKCVKPINTYVQNELCITNIWWDPDRRAVGEFECRNVKMCQNGGTEQSFCQCRCPNGYSGYLCEEVSDGFPTNCTAQLVTCQNGGSPTMFGKKCKCVCPTGFRGDRCQVNARQADNSVYWYFGKEMRYSSYYPVNATAWNVTYPIDRSVLYYMTNAVNEFCKSNYKVCCPESSSDTTSEDFVTFMGFGVTDFYPTGALDGSLKVGTHLRMKDEFVNECNHDTSPFVNAKAMMGAAESSAYNTISSFTKLLKVTTVRFDNNPSF